MLIFGSQNSNIWSFFVLQAPCLYTGWRWFRFVSFRFVSQITVSDVNVIVVAAAMLDVVQYNSVQWNPRAL